MVAFLYLVGMFVAFVGLAYFDVRGVAFFDFKPRSELRGLDLEMNGRLMFGGLACVLWPLALVCGAVTMLYRGLIFLFSRQPKKVKVWSCPMIKPANGYREAIQRCSVKARGVTAPKCGRHHCLMEEEG